MRQLAQQLNHLLDNLLNWAVSQTGELAFRPRVLAVAGTRDGFELSRIYLEQRREGNVLGTTSRLLERSIQDPAEAAGESAVTAEVYEIEQRAVEGGAIVVGQIDQPGFLNQPAQLNQVTRSFATLHDPAPAIRSPFRRFRP